MNKLFPESYNRDCTGLSGCLLSSAVAHHLLLLDSLPLFNQKLPTSIEPPSRSFRVVTSRPIIMPAPTARVQKQNNFILWRAREPCGMSASPNAHEYFHERHVWPVSVNAQRATWFCIKFTPWLQSSHSARPCQRPVKHWLKRQTLG